jgi:hypothetical protein
MSGAQIILAIGTVLIGGGTAAAAVWWMVSGVFGLRARLALIEGEIAHMKAEIASIHERCHAREMWMRESAQAIERVDKNVVKIAAKLDVEIEE